MVGIEEAVSNARLIKAEVQRAKSYLARHEVAKAVDTLLDALRTRLELPIIGADRFDIDMILGDFCTAFNKNSLVLEFLAAVGFTGKPYLVFKPGQEQAVLNKLAMYRLIAERIEENGQQRARQEHHDRRDALIRQGREFLAGGELPKARVCLKKAAEQYGQEPGVLSQVGAILIEAGAPADGADILRKAIDADPNDQQAYKALLKAYLDLGRAAEAEALYLETIKTFGAHPQTYCNLAKFYLGQRRYREAADAAQRALDLDGSLEEARAILRRHG